jgi:cell division septation protein DedD
MSDEGFHEIQLNGKQLVFLFMAATVVSVVIFLCGVMVGRGVVRAQQSSEPTSVVDEVATDPTLAGRTPPTVPAASSEAPLSTQETLTYPERLEEPEPPAETLRELPPPAPEPTAGITPPPGRIASTAVRSEPAGSGFVVQVAAVRQRGEADTIARRLSTKGYPAFVTSPPGAPHLFRVRVGKFQDRREAESIAGRLEKEEQFKPWLVYD